MKDAPPPPPPPGPPPPRSNNLSWLWIVLALLLCMFLSCGGLIGGCAYVMYRGINTAITSSEEYQEFERRLAEHPEIKERLGEPIETRLSRSSVSINNDEGASDLTVRIEGPEGDATAEVEAEMRNGVWDLKRVVVEFEDGSEIDITQDLRDAAPAAD